MEPRDLIRLEAELEYGVAIHGDVIPVTAANTRNVPRVTVARHADGYEMLFRDGLSDEERAVFVRIGAERLFSLTGDEIGMLRADASCGYRVVDCCWYCITRIPDPAEFPDVVQRDGRFVIEQNGQIAAEAWSSQFGDRADEVEVETQPAFRRRGFGRQVVAAWAHQVRREGKVALYSHLTSNAPSRSLAASAGALFYAETREYFGVKAPASE